MRKIAKVNIKYIGIDIGGTTTRVALVDAAGKIFDVSAESTKEGAASADDFLRKLIRMIESVENGECSAIGLGVPGMVTDGRITTCRNLKMLVEYPLDKLLEKHFRIPVFMQNDAKLAAFGEAIAGAGAQSDIAAFVGLGTGLGGGVVINKQLYLGAGGLGGYFSRMILDGENTAEQLVSGNGLHNQIKAASGNDSSIKAYFSGSGIVPTGLRKKFIQNLCNLLVNISVTINPDIIVLGGGVMESAPFFLDETITLFKNAAHDNAKKTIIVGADLEYPGVTGAALYAKLCLTRPK